MRRIRVRLVVFLAVMSWMMLVPPAQAYIDPGSTSMIFSALVAGMAAVGTAIAMFWHRVTSAFRRGSAGDVSGDGTDGSGADESG